LDDDDTALGITITDGIVDEAQTILLFAENELNKSSNG
jgi:hypothetical protein